MFFSFNSFPSLLLPLDPPLPGPVPRGPRKRKHWDEVCQKTQSQRSDDIYAAFLAWCQDEDISPLVGIKHLGHRVAWGNSDPGLAGQIKALGSDPDSLPAPVPVPVSSTLAIKSSLSLSVREMTSLRQFCLPFGLNFPSEKTIQAEMQKIVPSLKELCGGVAADVVSVVHSHIQRLPPATIQALAEAAPDRQVTAKIIGGFDGSGSHKAGFIFGHLDHFLQLANVTRSHGYSWGRKVIIKAIQNGNRQMFLVAISGTVNICDRL